MVSVGVVKRSNISSNISCLTLCLAMFSAGVLKRSNIHWLFQPTFSAAARPCSMGRVILRVLIAVLRETEIAIFRYIKWRL